MHYEVTLNFTIPDHTPEGDVVSRDDVDYMLSELLEDLGFDDPETMREFGVTYDLRVNEVLDN